MAAESTNSGAGARVRELDLLRFVAAMMVVLYHYTFRCHAADNLCDVGFPELAPVTKYGFLGVELFFIISGFVILMTASSGSLQRFLISRIVRLYPAYWVCCTLTFIVILVWGQERFTASIGQWLINLTMFNEFVGVPSLDGVYWSLAVEIKFYLMVMLVLGTKRIGAAQRLLWVWLGICYVLQIVPSYRLQSIFNAEYGPFFIIGAMAYLVHSKGWTAHRGLAIALAWALALKISTTSASRYDLHYRTHFDPWIVGGVVSAFVVFVLMIATRKTLAMARINWAVFGTMTYPLYLLHQNIGYMAFNHMDAGLNRFAILILTVGVMLGLAYLVHVCVEKPLSARMKRGLEVLLHGGANSNLPGRSDH